MDKHYGEFFEYSKKILLLSEAEYDFLNFDAIYSDETENYRFPCEPTDKDEVNIKIRLWKDNLKAEDKVTVVSNKGEFTASKCDTKGNFDYYNAVLPPAEEKTTYFFKIIKNGRTYCYNKNGIRPHEEHNYDFVILPNFKTPDWAKGAVMYQIYVDRFYNGDKSNDVVNNEYAYMGQAAKQIRNWEQPVANMDICNFYGGDLKGVEEKLDYLCELGIDVIYFNPIFVSPSNHKYDIQDYDYIDPHYGVIVEDGGEPLYFEKFSNKYATKYMQRTTDRVNLEASNKFFAEFVEKAHKRGIRVILDGVFNHCGAFNKWLDKEGFYHRGKGYPDGAYRTEDSIYHDYFKWFDNDWPNNDCYDAWWGHDNHPKLNYEGSRELYDYILGIGKKWVSAPYNADGWRLDVAADLGRSKEFNHKFWRDFRNAVKEANPEAIILAEHYGDATDWLNGDQWDTVMNYDAFMEPITWFLTGMEKHSEDYNEGQYNNAMSFEGAMRFHGARLSYPSMSVSMNELSNHDHSRFLTRTNKKVGRLHTVGKEEADTGINKAIMREAVTFQMTWPGAPTIYYGDEAGVTGWTDPDNRRTYPWGKEDKELIEFHKDMIRIHKENELFTKGSLEYLHNEYGILSYGRWYKDKKAFVILNNNNCDKEIDVPVWKIEAKNGERFVKVIESYESGYDKEKKEYVVEKGKIKVRLKAFSSVVLLG